MKLNDNADNLQDFEEEIKSRGFLSLWRKFQNDYLNRFTWEKLREWEETFKPFGLSFDWGMDAEPFDFELI